LLWNWLLKTKLLFIFCYAKIRILARPFSDSFSSASRPPLWQLTDLHLSIMQALEEAQGSPDKLQSAPGVNLVRRGFGVIYSVQILQNAWLEEEICFAVDALHTKQTQCIWRVLSCK
jgi:hypothetical protein